MRIALLLLLVLTTQSAQVQRRAVVPDEGIYGAIAGELIRETPHFQIYAEKSYVPLDLDWLQAEAEAIYAYLIERMGVPTNERFALTFRPPDPSSCPIRGLARFDEPVGQAIVYVDAQMSRARVSGILAHEIAHLFHARVLVAGTLDQNLTEGFATWAAGKYWQGWQGTPTDNVREYRREGRYKSLEESYRLTPPDTTSSDCLGNRDLKYNSWAAFIDFLIADYGFDKFRQLLGPRSVLGTEPAERPTTFRRIDPALISTNPIVIDPALIGTIVFVTNPTASPLRDIVPSSDFKGVYGSSLDELEKLWLNKLN